MHTLAHGLGGRTDLPLDAAAAIAGGGLAVAASFLALTLAWRRPRLGTGRGRPLPAARVLSAPATLATGRALALAATALVTAAALTGPRDPDHNLAPWALYVTFWVGLVPASVLLGPVWRAVNPLRTLHRALHRLTRTDPDTGRRPYPERLGRWPAAAGLTAFVWLELVAPDRTDPRLIGTLILTCATAHLALARLYGPTWFTRGDPFEVYSTLLARMSPLGRRPDGTWTLRTPLADLTRPGPQPGLTAVACVLIGSTAFDGITRTSYWKDNTDPHSVTAGTLGLATAITAIALLYTGALHARARLLHRPATGDPDHFAPTLLPIALGYTVAHYFSFLLLEGQMTIILATDPLGTGLDLLGTKGHRVDHTLVTPALTALVQLNAIVLGHLAATLAAHDLALRTDTPRRAALGQAPLTTAMIILTCGGLFALLSG